MPQPRQKSRRPFFDTPQGILGSFLLDGEDVLYDDAPSLNAFLIGQLPLLVIVGLGCGAAILWAGSAHHPMVIGWILVALGFVLAYLFVQRTREIFTRYVLTSFRVMRISGVLSRSNDWIPWIKVTDVRYEASFVGRLLGFATLSIDSANDASGLKELKNLRDPAACEAALVKAVQARQGGLRLGTTTPLSTTTPEVANIAELSARLAELLAVGPVTVTITYPDGATTSPTARGAVIVIDESAQPEDMDPTIYD